MPEDTPQEPHVWSLDDVDDATLMARLSKLPGFAHLSAPPPSDPPATAARGGADGPGIVEQIKAAVSEVMAKSQPQAVPSPPPQPQVVERVVEKAHSWFFDE